METINIEILFQRSFPMPSKHRGCTVKTHQLFCHASYSLKTNRNLIVIFKSFFNYYVPNIIFLGQILFRIKLRRFLHKSVDSFFIWYPIDTYYLFSVSDIDIKQNARRIVFWFGKKCVLVTDKLHSALYIFTVARSSHSNRYLCSLYAHCTQQRTVRSLACNN